MQKEDTPPISTLPNYCPRCRSPLQLNGECVLQRMRGCPGNRKEHLEYRSIQIPYSVTRREAILRGQSEISIRDNVIEPPRKTAVFTLDDELTDEIDQALGVIETYQKSEVPIHTMHSSQQTTIIRSATDRMMNATTLRRPAPPKKPNSG
ncbi:hypothetical protein IT408_02315 [Candidatus Uhrbacteria bacterium]|nr:hypothetical protein [Candidatus Uhrbacteria bacterium]